MTHPQKCPGEGKLKSDFDFRQNMTSPSAAFIRQAIHRTTALKGLAGFPNNVIYCIVCGLLQIDINDKK